MISDGCRILVYCKKQAIPPRDCRSGLYDAEIVVDWQHLESRCSTSFIPLVLCCAVRPSTMESEQDHAAANESELTVTIVGAVMIVLSMVSVAFRFYTRFHMKAALWWDDWMALVAVVSAVAAGAVILAGNYSCPLARDILAPPHLLTISVNSFPDRSRRSLAANRV